MIGEKWERQVVGPVRGGMGKVLDGDDHEGDHDDDTPIPTGIPDGSGWFTSGAPVHVPAPPPGAPRPLGFSAPEPRRAPEGAMSEMVRRPNNNQPSGPVPITRNDPLPDFEVMIRIAPNGTIVKNKGGTEELAGVVAYTQRLVELVGDLLGLDRFVAMECTFKGTEPNGRVPSHCLLFSEANGDTVALRPRVESNIQPLRESLGL